MKIGKFKKIAAIGLALTMAIGLLYTSGTVNAVDNNSPDATTTNDVEGLELNKTAVYDEDTGKYKITLDAFTTGEVTTETSSKPLDIVLVLDQSGSMADPFDYDYEVSYEKYAGHYLDSSNRPLYYSEDGINFYPVNVEVEQLSGVGHRRFIYTYEKDGEMIFINQKDAWAWGWGFNFIFQANWISEDWNLYYQQTNSQEISRVESLKDSVTKFVGAVREDAIENNVVHNIAMVGFGSKSGYGNNTEVLTVEGDNSVWNQPSGTSGEPDMIGVSYNEANSYTYSSAMVRYDSEMIDHAIAALATNGATRADLGMEMAERILSSTKKPDRQQVVIMFTDGEPTDSNYFQDWVANDAIGYSKNIKDDGAKVYTIGIFNGANPDDTSDESNEFMNYTSNNYPYATDMYNAGQRGSGNYYFAARDAGELNNVFEQISEDISEPTLELGANAIIKDSMSDYFDLIVDENKYPITVQKLRYTGKVDNNYTFDERNPVELNDLNITPTKDGISVSGFDFDTNYVRTENEVNKGYKLRITFYAEPIDGFIGGLSVPTNGADSGLYEDSSATTPLESFEIPTVDVDLNYDFDVTNQGMYVGNDWKDVQKFLNATDEGVAYKIGNNPYNTKNDFVNDFVNIIYTIKIKQKDENNQDIYVNFGTYTVENGKPTGTLSLNESFDAKDFRDTQEFVVSVDVINKNDQQSLTDHKDTQIKSIGGDKNANLYIFVPTIDTEDSIIDLGKEDKLNSHLTEKQWVCTEGASISESAFEMGDRPNLVFEYTPANNENSNNIVENTFTPNIVGQHEFYVTVKNSNTGIKITDATVFNHETDICETDPCNENHFYVTVVGGSITILKQIDESSTIDLSKGEPTFTFKVEQKDGDSYKTIGYKTIHMKNTNGQWEQNEEIIFNGLSAGEYRITELKTMRFDVESVCKGLYSEEILHHSDGSVTIKIGGLYNNDITLTYENRVKSSSYESDGSGLINKFESDGGTITVRPERLYDNATE